MDTQRALLAVVLSFIILLGYQYLFVGPPEVPPEVPVVERAVTEAGPEESNGRSPVPVPVPALAAEETLPLATGREIPVETPLFSAVFTETGGGVRSFRLKEYRESIQPDSGPKELIKTERPRELPLFFSWGVEPDRAEIPVFTADVDGLRLTAPGGAASMRMTANLASGLVITRTMTMEADSYLYRLRIEVNNPTDTPLQGAPYLSLTNSPFGDSESPASGFLFSGPAVFANGSLQEFKPADLQKSGQKVEGAIQWAAYEGNYFICAVLPGESDTAAVLMAAEGDRVTTLLTDETRVIPARSSRQYEYTVFFGPKKISLLKEIGSNLDQAVNFGWFDVVAKPTHSLLNFLYRFIGNYGLAIILVTTIIKMLFWPISHKGMKSMKNMQALKPKIDKIREKYKDDATKLNQEMMNLYKTYKVNPLGGCLPMVLQIPVFFALYKVLLQAIELRHAPFMLWINDLSAPDRLSIGVDIPYLGGIPVLTLLMGASMFFQQKLTPTAADPTQAKIMLFLPVIFTVMFVNFASGLVLYWLVNNLLSIGQQYMINRSVTVA